MARAGLFGILLLLAACEGDINIDLSATPPQGVNAAVLRIEAVELIPEGGTARRVAISPPLDLDMRDLDRGQVARLISGAEIDTGTYTGVRLLLVAQPQTLDSFIENADGGEQSLVLAAGSSSLATGRFSLREGETTGVTLHLDMRSSLAPSNNPADDRPLSPRLRLVEDGDAATISGDVETALLTASGCDSDNDPLAGEVIYVYSGSNVVADDLDGLFPEPLTTALIRRDDPAADYVVPFLPAGDYTLAVSCVADLDNPNVDDALGFAATRNASVASGGALTLNFTQ